MKKLLAALLGPIAALLLLAAPAAAHGGDGQLEITSVTRDGDDVTVTAHLIYIADGHGVPDATVTVVVDDGTPVPMEAGAEEGDYQATVPAGEGATIRVTSVEPATSVEAAAPGAAEETTTTAADTTTTAAETTTTAVEATSTTATDDEGEDASGPNGLDEAPEDSNGNVIVIAVIAVVAVAAIVAAVVLRRKPKAGDGDGPGTGAGSGAAS